MALDPLSIALIALAVAAPSLIRFAVHEGQRRARRRVVADGYRKWSDGEITTDQYWAILERREAHRG
jgi:hypothetical protein